VPLKFEGDKVWRIVTKKKEKKREREGKNQIKAPRSFESRLYSNDFLFSLSLFYI